MMRAAPVTRSAGFTLLEVLVALGIFALFSAMAYGSLVRLLENRERLEIERAFWREISLLYTRMQDDFTQARERRVRDTDGQLLFAFIGQPTGPSAISPPSVELTRGGAPTGVSGRPDLQRIGYRLADGVLYRLTWPVLDRAPGTRPLAVPVFEHVEEFQVRFYENTWLNQWPPQPQQPGVPALPRAVEVTIVHRSRGKFTRTFLVGGS